MVEHGTTNWIEKIPPPSRSQFIFIRHGESLYTNSGLDITEKGIAQIRETTGLLRGYLKKFDCLLVVSSISPRALGSAQVFLSEGDVKTESLRMSKGIRGVDIKDIGGF